MDNSELILAELRELRADYSAHARETGERLASLETSIKHAITGNGQPSRLQLVERAVEQLQAWRYRAAGLSAGIAGGVSLIGWAVMAWITWRHR